MGTRDAPREGMRSVLKRASIATSVVVGALALVPHAVDAEGCDAWDVEYVTAANLELRDTPMGEGDGFYRIGPGRAVIRYSTSGEDAKLVSYQMTERFVIESRTLFWTTRVTTDSFTRTAPDRCGVVANGVKAGPNLRWTTPLAGYRTDGTLVCDGSLCGKFGAPPAGRSELHIPPHPVAFAPFTFAADGKTFSMPNTQVSKTETPKQTAFIALSGREARRTCVAVPPCR
jgi:hypothetical protein